MRSLKVLVICIVLLFVGSGIYVSDYYHAESVNQDALVSNNQVEVVTQKDRIDFVCNNSTTGLVFYPGGKVEYTAYSTLCREFAEKGITTILLKVPFNLAVLDVKAADSVLADYLEIEHWMIGGHSLGGTVASMYLADHLEEYEGLLLLGSYTSKDLSDTDLDVFCIYGSNDQIMNRENYQKSLDKLPEGYTEYVIEGGNHSGFGDYGHQKKDGELTISSKTQKEITVDVVKSLILE